MPLLESRSYRRFSVQAPCLIHPSRTRRERKSSPIEVETRNISRGGLCFETSADWVVGTEFVCVIQFPNVAGFQEPIKLRCRGEIVRVAQAEKGRVEVGATIEQFSFLHPGEKCGES